MNQHSLYCWMDACVRAGSPVNEPTLIVLLDGCMCEGGVADQYEPIFIVLLDGCMCEGAGYTTDPQGLGELTIRLFVLSVCSHCPRLHIHPRATTQPGTSSPRQERETPEA